MHFGLVHLVVRFFCEGESSCVCGYGAVNSEPVSAALTVRPLAHIG